MKEKYREFAEGVVWYSESGKIRFEREEDYERNREMNAGIEEYEEPEPEHEDKDKDKPELEPCLEQELAERFEREREEMREFGFLYESKRPTIPCRICKKKVDYAEYLSSLAQGRCNECRKEESE